MAANATAAGATTAPRSAAAQARAASAPLWFLYTAIGSLVLFCTGLVPLVGEAMDGTLAPRVLALIHLATLGVLSAAIIGALLQLLPVILVAPAPPDWVGRALYAGWVAGTGSLVAGFWVGWWPALAAGGTLVVLAALAAAAVLWATILRAPRKPLAAIYVALGLGYLLLAVLGGLAMAIDRQTGLLGAWAIRVLPAHILVGFVGWGVSIVVGVSYKLAPMFALAHVHDERPGWVCLVLLNSGLLGLSAVLLAGWPAHLGLAAGALILAALLCFAFDLVRILRGRNRGSLEPTQWHAITGLVALLLCGGFAMHEALGGEGWWLDGRTATALGLLFLLGFAAQTIMGYLYKIVPFLIWNRRYAPRVGRAPVPMMRDMIHARLAAWTFLAYNLGLALLLGAVLWARELAPLAAALVAAAVWAFAANLIDVLRTRRPRAPHAPLNR